MAYVKLKALDVHPSAGQNTLQKQCRASQPVKTVGWLIAVPVKEAMGAGGRWLPIEVERFARSQIFAPLGSNLHSRKALGATGPRQQALAGAEPGSGQTGPFTVRHIVRSFASAWFVGRI